MKLEHWRRDHRLLWGTSLWLWNLRELSFEALIPGFTGAAGLLSPSSVSTKYFLESKHTTLLVESTSHSAHVLRKVVFLTGWASQKSSKDENASHHRMANCVVGQNKYTTYYIVQVQVIWDVFILHLSFWNLWINISTFLECFLFIIDNSKFDMFF